MPRRSSGPAFRATGAAGSLLALALLAALSAVAFEPTRVVLVAHSQGTVIAAATLMQCTRDDEHYPLLTFGAPLRRLYARNFPAYFGALGPAHSAELLALVAFALLASFARPRRSAALRTR